MSFTLRGRTSQCISTYIHNGADARTVRPYIPVMAILIRKMMEMESYANACRDARPVRPLKTPRAFASTTMLFACYSPCADARTNVYRLTFSMERTHEPCVPTCLLLTNHLNNKTNPKGQSSMFKVQSQGLYMPVVGVLQCSNIKVQSLMLIPSRP